MSDTGIDDAITQAGGVARLGKMLGIAHTTVARWRDSGSVPPSRVLAVEAATGVSRHRLRPDLYANQPGLAETQTPLAPQALALGLDPQAIATAALRAAIGAEKARRWAADNQAALAAHARTVEAKDTPLATFRMF